MDIVKIPAVVYEIDFSKIKCEISQRDLTYSYANNDELEHIYEFLDLLDITTQIINSLDQQQFDVQLKKTFYQDHIPDCHKFRDKHNSVKKIFTLSQYPQLNILKNLDIQFPTCYVGKSYKMLGELSKLLYYKILILKKKNYDQFMNLEIIDLHKFLYIYTSQEFILHPYEIICNFEDNLLILMNYMHPFYFERFMLKIKADPKCQFVRKCSITYLLNLIGSNLTYNNEQFYNFQPVFFKQNLPIFIRYMVFHSILKTSGEYQKKFLHEKVSFTISLYLKYKFKFTFHKSTFNLDIQTAYNMLNQLLVAVYRKQAMQLNVVKMLFAPIN